MSHRIVPLIVVFCLLLAACAGQEVTVPTSAVAQSAAPADLPTSTPDPCAAENLELSIKQVNDLMREFEDAYQLASNVPQAQAPSVISDMQRIRRTAEDQRVPACLTALKTHQLAHMNALIDVMLAFIGGADTTALTDGLAKAQKERELYTMEMAGLLGIESTPTAGP